MKREPKDEYQNPHAFTPKIWVAILTFYCLAKVLWTGQTKNCILSVGQFVSVCVCVCVPWAAHCMGIVNWYLLFDSPLCQTSCPLRTVHLSSIDQGILLPIGKAPLTNSYRTDGLKNCTYTVQGRNFTENVFPMRISYGKFSIQRVRLDKDWIVPTRWSWMTNSYRTDGLKNCTYTVQGRNFTENVFSNENFLW